MQFPRLQSFTANTKELKLASIIAILASFALAFSVLWLSISTPEHQPAPTTATVQVIEKVQPQNIKHTTAIEPYSQNITHTKEKQPTASIAPYQQTIQIKATNTIQAPQQPRQTNISPTQSKQPTTRIKIIMGKGTFYIQVGAYQKKNLAQRMHQKMKQQYKRAKIVTKGDMYAVWVGPVATKSEVSALKKRLLRLNKLEGFIVTQ